MEKISITLGKLLQLESEINGFVNPQTNQTIFIGFRKHKLPLTTKYWLTELGDRLIDERKMVDGLRDELIQKYGEELENGEISISMFTEKKDEEGTVISRTINPTYLEFQKEFNELLAQEKELEYHPLTMEDLERAGETTDNYDMLFTLVQKPQ